MRGARQAAFRERCRRIQLILTDVDGVMTDGSVLMLPDGRETRIFSVRDGLAVVLAHRAGIRTGLLSGRSSEVVARRAADLGMSVVRQGVRDKGAALREILAEQGLSPAEVAYVGDDLNDLSAMAEAGLTAAPSDAAPEVREQAFIPLQTPGGHGCLRELIEAILRARGEWERLAAAEYGTGRRE